MDPVFWEMVKAFGPWCIPTILLWILIREQRAELTKEREQNAKNLEAERQQGAADAKADRKEAADNLDKLINRNDANLVRHWMEYAKLKKVIEQNRCRYDGQCGYKITPPTPVNYPNSQGPIGERK